MCWLRDLSLDRRCRTYRQQPTIGFQVQSGYVLSTSDEVSSLPGGGLLIHGLLIPRRDHLPLRLSDRFRVGGRPRRYLAVALSHLL